ncbi:MAG: hypothetical protein OXI87_09780 [Albidovulum sp.]|nr:hypothetical protein [Albidovulum sp.]
MQKTAAVPVDDVNRLQSGQPDGCNSLAFRRFLFMIRHTVDMIEHPITRSFPNIKRAAALGSARR